MKSFISEIVTKDERSVSNASTKGCVFPISHILDCREYNDCTRTRSSLMNGKAHPSSNVFTETKSFLAAFASSSHVSDGDKPTLCSDVLSEAACAAAAILCLSSAKWSWMAKTRRRALTCPFQP